MEEAVAAVVVGVLTVVGTVWVAWWTATTHYYRQRWWERKAQAYSDLVAALTTLLQLDLAEHDETLGLALFNDEMKKAMRAKYHQSKEVIEAIGFSEGFLVNRETALAIRKFRIDLDKFDTADHLSTVEKNMTATRECIKAVTAQAKIDLKIS